jgi:predicted aspartyl protease
MKRTCSHAFDPPAPVVPIFVRHAPAANRLLEGKLDTGADICAIPDVVIAELALPPVGTVRAAGYAGELRELAVYRVDVLIEGKVHRHVKALSTRRPYFIVGRNILQAYVLRLDGPNARLELKRPATRKRKST